MVDKKSIIPIRKIEWQKLYDEEQAGLLGFYGVVFNYLLYHGVVIPRNKLIGYLAPNEKFFNINK